MHEDEQLSLASAYPTRFTHSELAWPINSLGAALMRLTPSHATVFARVRCEDLNNWRQAGTRNPWPKHRSAVAFQVLPLRLLFAGKPCSAKAPSCQCLA